ncbi:MAG: hypothetical protein ACT4OW_02125 [Nitrososphaerota archaeon]
MQTLSIYLALGIFYILMIPTSSADQLGNEHSRVFITDSDGGATDFNFDGKADLFVRAHNIGNEKQLYKIDYTLQDSCVQGTTYDSARMKIGFTNLDYDYTKRFWLSQGIEAWNPWFKSKSSIDENKIIDLATNFPWGLPLPFSTSNGDDVIVKNPDQIKGSFMHQDKVSELDGQSGWSGSVFFRAHTGEYLVWAILPSGGNIGCSGLAGIGIPVIIE